VLLPLKYEIDDSVSVTVGGSVTGGGGALYAYRRDIQVRRRSIVNSTHKRCRHRNLQFTELLLIHYIQPIFGLHAQGVLGTEVLQ